MLLQWGLVKYAAGALEGIKVPINAGVAAMMTALSLKVSSTLLARVLLGCH